jgi:hypothetical protein
MQAHVIICPQDVAPTRLPEPGIARAREARFWLDDGMHGQPGRVSLDDPIGLIRARVRDHEDLKLMMQWRRSERQRPERFSKVACAVVRANHHREERSRRPMGSVGCRQVGFVRCHGD